MKAKSRHLAAFPVTLGVLLALPVTGASASTAAARAAIKTAELGLVAQDARVESAIENYANAESSARTPMELETAIGEELGVLRALRSEVKSLRLPAKKRRLRSGKADMLLAAAMMIGAYEDLTNTFASPSVTPKLAKTAFRQQRLTIGSARRKLRKGATLLR
jgi:hypothetical protein